MKSQHKRLELHTSMLLMVVVEWIGSWFYYHTQKEPIAYLPIFVLVRIHSVSASGYTRSAHTKE